jgi:hypothetical protein
VPREPIIEFVVPLDRAGACPGIQPIGKLRVVDLRPGDSFVHRPTQKPFKLAAMSTYRQNQVSDELLASGDAPADGYLVPR